MGFRDFDDEKDMAGRREYVLKLKSTHVHVVMLGDNMDHYNKYFYNDDSRDSSSRHAGCR